MAPILRGAPLGGEIDVSDFHPVFCARCLPAVADLALWTGRAFILPINVES
jgi:hypothetical protein